MRAFVLVVVLLTACATPVPVTRVTVDGVTHSVQVGGRVGLAGVFTGLGALFMLHNPPTEEQWRRLCNGAPVSYDRDCAGYR